MTPDTIAAPLDSSRLVRLLMELGTASTQLSRRRFSERLGEMIDLSDSIKLSLAHGKLRADQFKLSRPGNTQVLEEFSGARRNLVKAVIAKFSPTARTRMPDPEAEDAPEAGDSARAAEAYRKFYEARQRELEYKIGLLHARVRDQVADSSPAMAQLCTLDTLLGDTMSGHKKRIFTAVPRLLARRIEQLHAEQSWADSHSQVRAEMQALLLAETEARLLPTLGLIEALDEHHD